MSTLLIWSITGELGDGSYAQSQQSARYFRVIFCPSACYLGPTILQLASGTVDGENSVPSNCVTPFISHTPATPS